MVGHMLHWLGMQLWAIRWLGQLMAEGVGDVDALVCGWVSLQVFIQEMLLGMML